MDDSRVILVETVVSYTGKLLVCYLDLCYGWKWVDPGRDSTGVEVCRRRWIRLVRTMDVVVKVLLICGEGRLIVFTDK